MKYLAPVAERVDFEAVSVILTSGAVTCTKYTPNDYGCDTYYCENDLGEA